LIKQFQLLLNERILFPSTFELFHNGEMLNIADKNRTLFENIPARDGAFAYPDNLAFREFRLPMLPLMLQLFICLIQQFCHKL